MEYRLIPRKENIGREKGRILGKQFKDKKEDFHAALETYLEM
jgi:hypothetical protein